MTAVEKPTEAVATAHWREPVWRDPVWLAAVAAFALSSALVIGAIAGRTVAGIDLWALAVSGVSVAIGAAASVAIMAARRRHPATSSFDRVVQALPHASAVIDRSGRAVAANDAFAALFPDARHAPLAALGKWLAANDDGGDVIGRLIGAAAAGERHDAVVRLAPGVGPDGGLAWMRVSVAPLAETAGTALWTFEDVSGQQAEAAALRDSEAALRGFFATAPVGFYAAAQDGRLLLVNDVLAAWLGYPPQALEAQGARLHDLLHHRAGEAPAHRLAKAANGSVLEEKTVVLRRHDGAPLQVAVAQSEFDGGGEGLRASGVVRRIEAQPGATVASAGGEARFQQMFENAPVGVVLLDTAGNIAESNAAWRRLVAPDDTAFDGRPLTAFVAEEDVDTVQGWLERVAAGPSAAPPQAVTLRTENAAGQARTATMYVGRVAPAADGGDSDGADAAGRDAGGLIVHFHDSTDQRALEEQFVQGQKMQAVGQLAGGVAHDFNNLLTAMIGFCDLLLLRHSPGDQSFGDIMQIKQNANRAARLVRQLLAFSRQQTLQLRVISITDVLGDLTNLLRRLIGANIKLEITHGRDLGMVKVDQGQLEQVVINLAVNARDAMRDGGTLAIRTYNQSVIVETRRGSEVILPGDYVVIEMADQGTGIAPDILERIFEPFFTTKEVGAGTGLGLSTVYGIVKQTGGQIFVDSTVGKGTTFTIMIPRHHPGAAEARKAEAADAPTAAETIGAGTILLVEDEDAVRLFSARALRAKGYKVLEARTGEAALELLEAVDDSIDLMITDAVMPEMDGPTLIKEMRDDRPDLPIICISGYAEETFREKLGESTDIHFLPKPFSLDQLAGKVKDVMSLPKP